MSNTAKNERVPKTVEIPADTLKKFRKYINDFPTRTDALEATDFNHTTLRNLLRLGTCSPATLERINNILGITENEAA